MMEVVEKMLLRMRRRYSLLLLGQENMKVLPCFKRLGDTYAIKLNEGQKALIKAIPSSGLDIGFYPCKNDHFKGEPEELIIEEYETRNYFFYVELIGETKGTYTLEISVQ